MPSAPQLGKFDLGFSRLRGADAVGECHGFKGRVLARFGCVDDAWLQTVVDEERQTRGFVAYFLPGSKTAEKWAERVRDAAPGIWSELAEVKDRVMGRAG
jgi:hypothetical protein